MSSPFVWFDLRSDDGEAARDFYAELLGWPTQDVEAGGPMLTMFAGEDGPWGAVAEPPAAAKGAHWLPYVQVDDVDLATTKATELGATVLQERTEGPAGSFVAIADPGGAPIALWQPASA